MAMENTAAGANETDKTFGTSSLDPGMYTLSAKVGSLPLKMDGKECLFRNVWERLSHSKIEKVERHYGPDGGDVYATEAGKVQIAGFGTGELLRDLLKLHGKGVDPFAATWFPYDRGNYEDVVVHSFFVLYDGKIVEEDFTFASFYPLVLERPAFYNEDPLAYKRQYYVEARECYWYRKFYTETMAGQLMVLRSDKPWLYYFERPTRDLTSDVTLAVLTKLYYLLWVFIPVLGAIAFPSLRLVMAIAAVILLGLWAIVCRRLRKAGAE
jgi:hypothetical protein